MAVIFALLGAAFLGAFTYGAVLYARLSRLKTAADKSWAGVDLLLKQRYEEIPRLLKVCEGYMKFESETFESVRIVRTKFLAADTPGSMAAADAEIARSLKALFGVAENYPALKTNENFMQLQGRVRYLDSQMAGRVEDYNDSASAFNSGMARPLYGLVARAVGYFPRELFKNG